MPSVDPAKPGQMMRASHFAFPGAVLNAQVHVVSPSPGESSWLSICAHQCLQRLDVFASGVHTESWPKGRVWSCERMRHWGAQTLSASPVEESTGQEGPYWHSAVPPWGKGDASKPQLFLLPSSLHAISDIFAPTTVCWTSLLDYQTSTRALLSMGDCQNQVLVVGRKQWLLSCHVWLFVTTPPPRTAAHQASLSFTTSQSLLKFMTTESVMLSNHLILCRPILLPSIFSSIMVFFNELALCIRRPK